MSVPVFSSLNNWSKYTTAYGYVAIYKHKVTEKQSKNLNDQKFNLHIMEVPSSSELYYISFLEPPLDVDTWFAMDDLLYVSFDSDSSRANK